MISAGLIFIVAAVLGVVWLSRKRKMQYWLGGDICRGLHRKIAGPAADGCVHLMFAFVDHFEPGNGGADPDRQRERVRTWTDGYPQLADRHTDSDGVPPQHTFFFPPHYDTDNHLERIVHLCSLGYGEIEMHLHHDRQEPWPDDETTLRGKITDCIERFSRHGVFCLPDGRRTYAFIHGDWALANALEGSRHCGVNDEISVLLDTGCYADFTFPVSNEAQPRLPNTLFYGQSCRAKPKAYDTKPLPVRRGGQAADGLLFVQGIIGLRWRSRTHRLYPSIEQSNIDASDFPFPLRTEYWVNKAVCVEGRPDWIFVKIHTHGAREADRDTLLGQRCDDLFTDLESRYNDGTKYRLHYVSAREIYNIIKAAEDNKVGNPDAYRDYRIPRYTYLPSRSAAGQKKAMRLPTQDAPCRR